MKDIEEPKLMTIEEIKEALSNMRVDTGEYLPVKFFHVIVPNPEYDPEGFSQEIEDSEEEVNYIQELDAEAKREGFKTWVFHYKEIMANLPRKNSVKWLDNHTKRCICKLIPCAFAGQCIEHTITTSVDGEVINEEKRRDYLTDRVMKSVEDVIALYGGIYKIA